MTQPSEVVVTDADEAAALVALVRLNIPTHVQELLIYGSKTARVPPGALKVAIAAVIAARVPDARPYKDGEVTLSHACNNDGHNALRDRVLKGG